MDESNLNRVLKIVDDSVIELIPKDKLEENAKFRDRLILAVKYRIIKDPNVNVANPTLQIIKSWVRPSFTFGFMAFLLLFVIAPDHGIKVAAALTQVPSEMFIVLIIIITFWFGEKAVSAVLDKYKGKM